MLIDLYIKKLITKTVIKLNSKRSVYAAEVVIRRIRRNLITKRGKKGKYAKILGI